MRNPKSKITGRTDPPLISKSQAKKKKRQKQGSALKVREKKCSENGFVSKKSCRGVALFSVLLLLLLLCREKGGERWVFTLMLR